MCVCVCGKDATEVTSYDTFPSGRQSSLPLLPLASLRCSCRWFARPPWMDVACMRWAAARLTLGLRGGNLIYEGNLIQYSNQPTLEHVPFYQRCARALLRVELTVARSVHPPHHRGKHRAQQTGGAHALLVK